MKKVCLILAAVCMLLAIVFLALSLAAELPDQTRVSEMGDQQLMRFIQRYGLDRYKEASDLERLRTMASNFEKTGIVDMDMMLLSYIKPYWIAVTNALADYYDRPEATLYITSVD